MALTEETEALVDRFAAARSHGEDTEVLDAEDLVLGRYRLGRRLGAGGFGTVHEAVDERLRRRVAVKVIPADGSASDRARREAVAAARLEHPGIVAIFDAGEEPGARYLVSELVEGRTLAALEAAGELSDRDVLRIGLALCDALVHAHERGVVHRDVKPQNVLVPDRPRSWRGAAKLADFGVAMLAGDEPLTMTGDVVGTLAYMAPEQAAGKRVDERADLYALGLVLYEALAGTNPVRGASPAQTARRVGTQLPPLQRQRRDLPPELCAALDRAVLPEPGRRGDLEDLADALEDALVELPEEGGTIVSHPLERRYRAPGGLPRVAAAVSTGSLTAGALAAFGAVPLVPAAVMGAGAGLAAGLLPRVGWVAAAAPLVVALLGGGTELGGASVPGTALVLALMLFPVPLLLPRLPLAWSLPAAAPLLAVAFPAVAGRLQRWTERAALGALGAWWLVLAEPLLSERLLLGPAEGVPPREGFEGALYLTAGEVLAGTVTAGLPLLCVLWGLAAAALPWVVRTSSIPVRFVLASMWAAALAAATASLAELLALAPPRLLVPAAAGAAIVAIVPQRRYFDA